MGQGAASACRSAGNVPSSGGDAQTTSACSSACSSGLRRALASKEAKASKDVPGVPSLPMVSTPSGRRVSAPAVSPRFLEGACAAGAGASRRLSAGPAGNHKARLDRLLVSARSELGAALELEGLPSTARERLLAVDRKLREAELEQRDQSEEFMGLKVSAQWKRLLHHSEQGQKGPPVSEVTRSFLLQTYSHHNLDAVGSSRLQDTGRRSLQGLQVSPTTRFSNLSAAASGRWSLNSDDSPSSLTSPSRGAKAWKVGSSKISSSERSSLGSEDLCYTLRQSSSGPARVSQVIQSQQVRALLEKAGSLEFDAVAYGSLPEVSGVPLEVMGVELMEGGGLLEELSQQGVIEDSALFGTRLFRFLGNIDGLYKKDALYHGSSHAADVTSTAEWFMRMPSVRERTTVLDHMMLLVAAAVHDVGHPGTNPLFHVKTMSSLAIRYNDKSVLENFHISLAFETMLNPGGDCNWFALLPKDFEHGRGPAANVQQYVRRGLVEMVLATDMSGHAKHVSHLRELGADPAEWPTVAAPGQEQEFLERKLFLLDTLLHAADLSNPCKPQDIMLGWTRLLLSEFWAQGDEEIRLGLPVSPLCDRQVGTTTIPKGQLGFVQFVIEPFYSQIAELLPEAKEATDQLQKNRAFWEAKDSEHASYEEIFPASRACGTLLA